MFTAELASHVALAPGSTANDPGGGIFCDVAVLDLNDRSVYRLTSIGGTASTVGGTLHPRFSHDGTKLLWGDYVGDGSAPNPPDRFGLWQLAVADFVASPSPHLENVTYFKRGADTDFVEAEGFSMDDQTVFFACTALQGQDANTLDICSWNLNTQTLSRLVESSGLDDEPTSYEELAAPGTKSDPVGT